MSGPERPQDPPDDEAFAMLVRDKARRRLKARGDGDHGVWQGLGLFGMVGWSVTLPALLGLALGLWIDQRFPGSYSWTLMGLVLGIVLGCWNAWQWIQRQRDRE